MLVRKLTQSLKRVGSVVLMNQQPMVKKRRDGENQGDGWATRGPQPKHKTSRDHRTRALHGPDLQQGEADGNFSTVAWATKNPRKSLILVRLAGIEPTTLGFGGQYSIH